MLMQGRLAHVRHLRECRDAQGFAVALAQQRDDAAHAAVVAAGGHAARQPPAARSGQQPIDDLSLHRRAEQAGIARAVQQLQQSKRGVQQVPVGLFGVHALRGQGAGWAARVLHLEQQFGDLTCIDGQFRAQVGRLGACAQHLPLGREVLRRHQVTRRVVDMHLLAEQHPLAALHQQAHRRLVQGQADLDRGRKAIQAQAVDRGRVHTIARCVPHHHVPHRGRSGLARRRSSLHQRHGDGFGGHASLGMNGSTTPWQRRPGSTPADCSWQRRVAA